MKAKVLAGLIAMTLIFVVQTQFISAGTQDTEALDDYDTRSSDSYSSSSSSSSSTSTSTTEPESATAATPRDTYSDRSAVKKDADDDLRLALGIPSKTNHPVVSGDPHCKRWNAFENVWYEVNGVSVPVLAGNAKQGDRIDVYFEIAEECGSVPVSVATYNAVADHYTPENVKQQTLADHKTGSYSAADGISHLSIQLPSCYYQFDFVTDMAYENLTSQVYKYTLADAITGGTRACSAPPKKPVAQPETKEVEQPKPTYAPKKREPIKRVEEPKVVCPDDFSDRISDYQVEVDGQGGLSGYPELRGNVEANSEVTVTFTLAEECRERLSLVSYSAESTSDKDLESQEIYDRVTKTFGPGTHTMSVDVPECAFQVDFVRGEVIRNLSASNRYGDRLIDYDLGGEPCVEEEPEPEPVETEVQPKVVERAAPAELAVTGFNLLPMALLGGLLTAAGTGLSSLGRRFSDEINWDVD